jgi:hypothetical protein
MSVAVELKISDSLHAEARKVAVAEHLSTEEVLALWAEFGRAALSRPRIALGLLEATLASEVELVDENDNIRLKQLWAALSASST